MRRSAIVVVALLVAAPAAAREGDAEASPDPGSRGAAGLAGVYHAMDPPPQTPGGAQGESILEIVPLGRDEVYVRARTTWANYHSCSMYGIFRVERGALVHRGRTLAGETCEFTVERRADRLTFHDPSEGCLGACGARGKLDGDDRFRLGQRRPIRYLGRLLASRECAAAIAARDGRIPRPETYLLDRAQAGGPGH